MTMQEDDRPPKRRKLDASLSEEGLASSVQQIQDYIHKGLERPISPPLLKRKSPAPNAVIVPTWGFDDVPKATPTQASPLPEGEQDIPRERDSKQEESTKYVSSLFQLTHIKDMGSHQNVDAVQLKDILGNPMIKECWNFNFLFDVDFVM
jgi:tyrosyl-DNA phosphodiesterase-1